MCYDEGTLQEYLDGEVSREERTAIEGHLADCSRCSQLLETLAENRNFVNLHLTSFKKHINRREYIPAGTGSFQEPVETKEKGVFGLLKKYKKLAAAAAVVACMGVSLSFAPVRSAAAQLLTMFRIQKIETTSISIDDLRKVERALNNRNAKLDIDNFGTMESSREGKPRQVSWADASAEVDFHLMKPSYLPEGLTSDSTLTLEPASTAKFTLNVGNVNKVIKELGGSHLLPDNLDGQTFTLSAGQSLTFSAVSDSGEKRTSLSLLQTRAPELKVPENIDVDEVRKAVIDLPVIPEDLKQKLAALNNWQNTLCVPQPLDGTTEKVNVNGAEGVLVKENQGSLRDTALLMWQDDGVLYILHGRNLDGGELTKVAASMK